MPSDDRSVPSGKMRIWVCGEAVDAYVGVSLLRSFERLAGRKITEGNYCWTGECGHCEIVYATDGSAERTAMACCLMASPELRVNALSAYLRLDLAR